MPHGTMAVSLERKANQPISEGFHSFRIVNFGEDTGEKGDYWFFTCRCEDQGEDLDKEVRLFVSLSEGARWRREQFFDAVGAPTEGEATADQFVNRRFRAEVSHEEYNGRMQARLENLAPPSQEGGVSGMPKGRVSAGAPSIPQPNTRKVNRTAPPPTPVAKKTAAQPAPKGAAAKKLGRKSEDIPF